ncbi:type II toxin-antitoxin system RelE/ParE family toxin [uncultured Arcticibacterium sp.]|uniref:type II toxin-antitoxin system RelE/ParE family toxin n=1 Tax=uncultured Arcticibacterium sp. TaxID=2173042 RepID=UPI0030F6C930
MDAENDWRLIMEYTLDEFGEDQVHKYTKGLSLCLKALSIQQGYFKKVKIAQHQIFLKHCQKHYVFALERKGKPMLVLAIFHERMNLMQRLKDRLQ